MANELLLMEEEATEERIPRDGETDPLEAQPKRMSDRAIGGLLSRLNISVVPPWL